MKLMVRRRFAAANNIVNFLSGRRRFGRTIGVARRIGLAAGSGRSQAGGM